MERFCKNVHLLCMGSPDGLEDCAGGSDAILFLCRWWLVRANKTILADFVKEMVKAPTKTKSWPKVG